MLSEQSRLLQRLLFVADLLLIAAGWVIAYYLRFEVLPPVIELPLWRPLSRYISYLPPVMGLWAVVFVVSGLYAQERARRLTSLVYAVARAVFWGMAAAVAGMFFYRAFSFSRVHMLLFGMVTSVLMVGLRVTIFALMQRARQQGRNLQRVLIVGAGRVGRRLRQSLEAYPLVRFEVVGFLDDSVEDPDVLGPTDALPTLMDRLRNEENRPVNIVYITLPLRAADRIEQLVEALATRLARVYLVPDLFQFDLLNNRVSEIDGMPVIHLIDETPFEWRRVGKRLIDIVFSAGMLLVVSPLLLLVAIGVKLSSPGPVFYRQIRMGLNGQTFEIIKFRSMPVDAERQSGAVWARPGEKRATAFGAFLRRTSLDELPQFYNVLRGDMSIVGPRPERPVFIEQFKNRVPGYMLRHKMKAGITGWAQVNGWRGDTSIEKRIEYDLYYIQNWSLKLDFKIMLMTLWSGFVHENAY